MMPDKNAARVYRDGERVDAMHGYGYVSPWTAHWKPTTSDKSTTHPACNDLSVGSEVKVAKKDSDVEQCDLLGRSDAESHSSMHIGATRVGFVDEGENGKSKKESFGSKSFVISRLSQNLNGRSPFQRQEKSVFRGEEGKSGTKSYSGHENVSFDIAGSHLSLTSAQASPPNIETSVKEGHILSQRVPATSVQNNMVKSASDMAPTNGRDKGKSVMAEIIDGPREVHSPSLLDPQRSPPSRLMQDSFARIPQDPVADSDDDGLYVVRSQHHKIQNLIANPNITNQTTLLEPTKPQNFYGVSSSQARVPRSVYGVKAAEINTTLDSAEELSRGHPNISQTTHRFLISKNTDVNLSDKSQFFRESMTPTKSKGNNFNEIIDLSPTPPASDHIVDRLETLGSTRKSDKNELDTMDIDTLRENNLPGEVPLLNKDSQNSFTSQGATISSRGIPNINEEPRESSTSRTRSLDLDQLFAHAKGSSSSLGSGPSSRWVKRLKLSTLDSAHGTKSENIGETSHVKSTNIFSKIMEGRKTNMEVETVYHAEGQKVSNEESSFTEAKETVGITLSHPWIQRWGYNGAACSKKRHESTEQHHPKSSNTRQFPSIGAMALMGRAMNCFNPSEFTIKGPVIVWNTKEI
ncbi:hypothetical protein TSUD_89620 [Trifolium subterraneum]|uniref:Uncharacterized protein n=1 Tax=Trifolium subterraneum TaxID=3900 RepID=A0A2Z6NJQ5_TRISU|nr:hypothetical protein TSUD_89620 [Trifolium subterraneum]